MCYQHMHCIVSVRGAHVVVEKQRAMYAFTLCLRFCMSEVSHLALISHEGMSAVHRCSPKPFLFALISILF